MKNVGFLLTVEVMRKNKFKLIVFLAGCIAGLVFMLRPNLHIPMSEDSPTPESSEQQPLASNNSVTNTPAQMYAPTNTPSLLAPVLARKYNLAEIKEEKKSLNWITPESLYKYQGSYTLEELMQGSDNNDSLDFTLKSKWFLPYPNIPQAGVTIRMNPQTGQREVVGGEFFLPKSGFGISQETDRDTGANRTYFNIKKKF